MSGPRRKAAKTGTGKTRAKKTSSRKATVKKTAKKAAKKAVKKRAAKKVTLKKSSPKRGAKKAAKKKTRTRRTHKARTVSEVVYPSSFREAALPEELGFAAALDEFDVGQPTPQIEVSGESTAVSPPPMAIEPVDETTEPAMPLSTLFDPGADDSDELTVLQETPAGALVDVTEYRPDDEGANAKVAEKQDYIDTVAELDALMNEFNEDPIEEVDPTWGETSSIETWEDDYASVEPVEGAPDDDSPAGEDAAHRQFEDSRLVRRRLVGVLLALLGIIALVSAAL